VSEGSAWTLSGQTVGVGTVLRWGLHYKGTNDLTGANRITLSTLDWRKIEWIGTIRTTIESGDLPSGATSFLTKDYGADGNVLTITIFSSTQNVIGSTDARIDPGTLLRTSYFEIRLYVDGSDGGKLKFYYANTGCDDCHIELRMLVLGTVSNSETDYQEIGDGWTP
jgi:hypothetical protein